MAIKPVIRMGDPLLYKTAHTVKEFNTKELDSLVQDLLDTMQHEQGAGIAAPQIGVSLQVVIFGGFSTPRYDDVEEIPFTVLVNPSIEPVGAEKDYGWEGCLSVPGLRGKVPRHTHIVYRGFDAQGKALEREVSGFHARVVQHEVDHLFGVLFPLRVEDLKDLGYEEEMMQREDYFKPC